LGIDPGSHKIGIAVIDNQKTLVYKSIVKINNFIDIIQGIIEEYEIEDIALGNGNNFKKLISYINLIKIYRINQRKKLNIYIIDEKNSTIEARKIFLQQEKSFVKKIINYIYSLFLPLDDYSAFVIACRLFSKYNITDTEKQNL
ncbi:MAG: Holliday junction resolvase RuvX, partial [Candidatus Methanomethylicia archaeon]